MPGLDLESNYFQVYQRKVVCCLVLESFILCKCFCYNLVSCFYFGFDCSLGLLTSVYIYPIIISTKKNVLDIIFTILFAFLSYFCLYFTGAVAKVIPFYKGSNDFFCHPHFHELPILMRLFFCLYFSLLSILPVIFLCFLSSEVSTMQSDLEWLKFLLITSHLLLSEISGLKYLGSLKMCVQSYHNHSRQLSFWD